MKILLISLLFAFTLNAQDGVTRFFVNRDATGSNNGTSWTNAWTSPGSIVWNNITAGDTIYVSGGTDSTTYVPTTIYGFGIAIQGAATPNWTFASGNPVVICPSWEAGHNGDVYFVIRDNANHRTIMRVGNISNLKITGFQFHDLRTDPDVSIMLIQLGNGNWGDIDSLIYFEDNVVQNSGQSSMLYLSGCKTIFRNNLINQLENNLPNDNDPMGISSGKGGHTIDNNVIILRDGYEILDASAANAAITYTDTSMTDTRLNMIPNYYINSSFYSKGYYMIITSNDTTTLYGSAGWQFTPIERTSAITFTDTTMNHGTENFTNNSMVGSYLIVGTDTLFITGNTNYTFTGSAGWYPSTPSNGTYTWKLIGGAEPVDGQEYLMSSAHRDGIQISNLYADTSDWMPFHISNNLIIDTRTEGTGWNSIVYSSMGIHGAFYFYNNIIVARKTKTGMGGTWFNLNGIVNPTYRQSTHILNNTFIMKGMEVGSVPITESASDTVIIKNNLMVVDTTISKFLNTSTIPSPDVYEADYNGYFSQTDIATVRFPDIGFGAYVWAQWRAQGMDSNAITGNPSSVTFTSKYDTVASSYYTTTGRDSGVDLSADYPFLATDILGNPRTGTWDIGALEYQSGDTTAWYVNNEATGDSSGTSWINAFESFASINWSAITAGDTIYISGSSDSTVYNEILNIGKAGSSGSPIVITKGTTTGHNGKVIIDGGDSLAYNIQNNSYAYVNVQNLNLRNATTYNYRLRNSNNVVRACTLLVSGGATAGLDIRGSNNIIEYNVGRTSTDLNDGQRDFVQATTGSNHTFRYNNVIIENPDADDHTDIFQFFDMEGGTIRIHNNYMYQNNTKTNNAQGFYNTGSDSTRFIFYNNIVIAPYAKQMCAIRESQASLEAYNNVFYSGADVAARIFWIQDDSTTTIDSIYIKNNIFYSLSSTIRPIEIYEELSASEIDNNIIYAPNLASPIYYNGSAYTVTNWNALAFVGTDISSNPNFTNASTYDFTLLNTSPAIDAGTDLSAKFTIDYDDVTRSTFDIGAFEFTGTPLDTLPNAFTFTDITGATRSTVYTSNAITLAGFDSAYARAGGAEYNVNAGSYVTGYTKVFPTDVIRVRLTSSANYSSATEVPMVVGSRSDTYTVTTESEPITPPASSGGIVKGSNGILIKDSTGKPIRTAQ